MMTLRYLWMAALLLPAAAAAAVSVADDDGNSIEFTGPVERIVSLAPGATAMLFAAGAGARVVGTSAYSDEPLAARKIERIGDAQSFDLERILALHPDVVVVWSSGTPLAEIARLQKVGLRVYHHHVTRLEQIPDSLRRLGAMAGTASTAAAAADELSRRLALLRAQYGQPLGASVFIELWDHPLYTVGHDQIITDVIHLCGYRSAYEDLAGASPAVSTESVLARDPDLVLALSEDRSSAERWLQQWRSFGSMKAVRTAHMLAWSDERLTRIGPSEVDGAQALCEALHGQTEKN